ncbi:hypothetical protein BC939DRAFT_456971 [Gamsiella multidivaricata]|uniref:uncharacterized protein n=1 Tax=Gamsiella multidivaricata TaxID=101098 RepID=UPI00221EAB10|nr:uncharacterized protein BC939DRAFT_456971 [Gamsiella multidivaricata]KAI7820796.1 hypothetical protein BC939DRAFT_456971 [Gamsiella multidivaricata]
MPEPEDKTMLPVYVHQTSRHAVVLIQVECIDPHSISTEISSDQASLQLSLQHKPRGSSRTCTVTISARPMLDPSGSIASIQDCSCSISAENIVLRLTKTRKTEWQALRIIFKCQDTGFSNPADINDSDKTIEHGDQQEQTGPIIAKFVTSSNTTHLQSAIRTSKLWDAQSGRVGNIQAKKMGGVNAIQLTADLTPNSASVSQE